MSAPLAILGELRVEHLSSGFGVGTATPRLGWRTTAPNDWRQAGYQVEVRNEHGFHEADVVPSSEQVLVPWPTTPLRSRQRVDVRVRVYGRDGTISPWSTWTPVETGLLDADDWIARPVGGAWTETAGSDRRPSRVRKEFSLPAGIRSARLHASAHGVFEAEINGRRVGDDILSPGWTSYASRLRYRTYDVTDLVQEGANVLGAWLGDGWYRGRLGFNGGYHDLYGQDLAFLAQLEVTDAAGDRYIVATDGTWEASPSPILFSGLYDGERHDLRLDEAGWSMPGAEREGWTPVAVGTRDPATLEAYTQHPIRCTQEVAPVEVRRSDTGRIVLDFGQNLVGRLRLTVTGPAGHQITLRHAEVTQGGEIYRRTLRLAASEDVVTLDGTPDTVWEPRFTLHGFRYAEIENWPGDFHGTEVTARVYHTDMTRTGWFESSDPLLDRLHENVVWSMRGNFVDIPTDCPQRDERLGWTGDIQVFAPTASYLYDCAGLLSSWLGDLALEQLDDGTVPWFIPRIPGGPSWEPIQPGAVWGDVAVLTPWVLYQRFGDERVLEMQYPSAKAWVDLILSKAGPDRLWNDGFQLGDWLDPSAPPEDPADGSTDRYLVATAYLAQSTLHLALSAEVLGRSADAERYVSIAAEVRAAFAAEYGLGHGRLTSDAQTAYALAIVFDLLPGDQVQAAGDRLAQLVTAAGNRVSTGFAGTPVVTDALAVTGHVDIAYDLLLERSCPSWLYTVLQGGTTIWERWDSMLPDGTINPGEMTSFNHYALGAVADWMHRDIAGITPRAPGYRQVEFAPRPGGGLTHASGRHLSPYGEISSTWHIEGGMFQFTVGLPTGTSGTVILPDGSTAEVGPGRHEFRSTHQPSAGTVRRAPRTVLHDIDREAHRHG